MLEKFVEEFAKLAQQAVAPKLVDVGDAKKLAWSGGAITEINYPPPRREHTANSIVAVCDFAKANENSAVWYDASGAICVIDDAVRRDQITMPLEWSYQVERLLMWQEGKGNKMSQREAVLLFRTLFRDCLGRAGRLLESMRSMRSKSGKAGTSDIKQGKVSIDKSIDAEWSGVEQIPDDFQLEIPMFKSRFFDTRIVTVAIDADPLTESFTFLPIPGSLDQAIEQAEVKVGTEIATLLEGKSRLYYGSP